MEGKSHVKPILFKTANENFKIEMTFNQKNDDRFRLESFEADLDEYDWYGYKFYYILFNAKLTRFK